MEAASEMRRQTVINDALDGIPDLQIALQRTSAKAALALYLHFEHRVGSRKEVAAVV